MSMQRPAAALVYNGTFYLYIGHDEAPEEGYHLRGEGLALLLIGGHGALDVAGARKVGRA